MNKGAANINKPDNEKLMAMTIAAEKFEDEVLGLKQGNANPMYCF
jgi:hypothetical protein